MPKTCNVTSRSGKRRKSDPGSKLRPKSCSGAAALKRLLPSSGMLRVHQPLQAAPSRWAAGRPWTTARRRAPLHGRYHLCKFGPHLLQPPPAIKSHDTTCPKIPLWPNSSSRHFVRYTTAMPIIDRPQVMLWPFSGRLRQRTAARSKVPSVRELTQAPFSHELLLARSSPIVTSTQHHRHDTSQLNSRGAHDSFANLCW